MFILTGCFIRIDRSAAIFIAVESIGLFCYLVSHLIISWFAASTNMLNTVESIGPLALLLIFYKVESIGLLLLLLLFAV